MKTRTIAIAAVVALGLYVYGRQHGRATADNVSKTTPPVEAGWWTFAGNWQGAL